MISKTTRTYLLDFINPKYLEDSFLWELDTSMNSDIWLDHMLLVDFFQEDFLEWLISEILQWNQEAADEYTDIPHYKKGTGVYVIWTNMWNLEQLMHSQPFSEYLGLFLGTSVHTYMTFSQKLEFFLRKYHLHSWGVGCYLQVYNPWDFLNWHTDGPVSDVAGSFVLFLNNVWEKSQGGVLEFGIRNDTTLQVQTYKEIIPQLNTFVIFKCKKDSSWHRVTPVDKGTRITLHHQLYRR